MRDRGVLRHAAKIIEYLHEALKQGFPILFGHNWTVCEKSHKLPSFKIQKMKQILFIISILFTAIPCFTQSIPSYIPSDGLIGWWPFKGNATDESGNGNNGTVNCAVLTEDRFGNANSAYSFDGIDDFINAGYVNEISGSSQLSVSYWINSPLNFQYNAAGNYGTVIGHWKNDEDFPGSPIGYQDAIYGDGNFAASFIGAQGSLASQNIIGANSWQNITVVYNGALTTNERVALYLNGNFIQFIIVNNVPSQIGSTATRTYLGAACGPDGVDDAWSHFNGTIDDVGIWNRALNANEIQQLYTLNACTFTIYDTVTVTEIVYDTVSVSTTDTLIIETLITSIEPAQENTFLVYPNPANTQITINNGNFGILSGYE